MFRNYLVLFVTVIVLSSCNEEYKVGNLNVLGYPIETNLRSKIVRRYMDTLILNRGYDIPPKWDGYDKLIDIDSILNRRIYFKNEPEEMYLISFGGMLVLSDVYNPKINQFTWVAESANIPKEEELRIKKRFQTEILDTVLALAKRDGLPDSLIFK